MIAHVLDLVSQFFFTLLESKLRQERERGARKIQAVRSTCQNLVLNMAKTVKEYFKKTMEDTCRDHRKELQEAREQGIKEGMRRQRDLLQKNMVTDCHLYYDIRAVPLSSEIWERDAPLDGLYGKEGLLVVCHWSFLYYSKTKINTPCGHPRSNQQYFWQALASS